MDRDWRAYVERMVAYGNNAIVIPLLLELIDFTRVMRLARGPESNPVYARDSPFRARHAAVRRHFAPLFEWTDRRGMQVFLRATCWRDAAAPRHLRGVAPDTSATGIDTSNPAVWEVYRAGLEELFDTLPSIDGLVIRFGEGAGSTTASAGHIAASWRSAMPPVSEPCCGAPARFRGASQNARAAELDGWRRSRSVASTSIRECTKRF